MVFAMNVGGPQRDEARDRRHAKSGGRAIVNTSSTSGHVGPAHTTAYVASKHAVEGLTKCVALEFAKQNIRANTVSPAAIATDMIDRFAGHALALG
jgi:NAD(P)-dependent dehydrogenase (short-subunit alcohol dehydrogenase family)